VYRRIGTHAWLTGNQLRAGALWKRSLEAAESVGARYELARTHLEMGVRQHDPTHTSRAMELFGAMGVRTPQPDVA
jgi:hypothetical protein